MSTTENSALALEAKNSAKDYVDGKKEFMSLNFDNPKEFNIALLCLNERDSFAKQLDTYNPSHLRLLKKWVLENYSNLLRLDFSDLHSDLVDIYLMKKYELSKKDVPEITILRSINKKMIFCCDYVTKSGETVCYFDKALGVPTKLTTKAFFKLKINDSYLFVKKMDIDIQLLDLKISANYLYTVMNEVIRDCLLNIITENNLNYYDLPKYYNVIGASVKKALGVIFDSCGIEVCEVKIADIAVPNNTDSMLEKQYFAIAEAQREKEYEYNMEEKALRFYEKKAEIHNKYPDFPITLTETEKDLALNRYLRRQGENTALTAKIVNEKLEDRAGQGKGSVTKVDLVAPIEPIAPPKPKNFRKPFIIVALIFLILSSFIYIASVTAGFACMGSVILIFGIIAVVKLDALKEGKNVTEEYKEYERKYALYEKDYAIYIANKNSVQTENN